MRLSLYVSAPLVAGTASSALSFAEAAAEKGASLYRVFFFDQAVVCASEPRESAGWRKLHKTLGLDLCLCSASATRHGIISQGTLDIPPSFSVGGLVQLVDAQSQSDRLVSFL